MNHEFQLTPRQVEQFRENGYLVVDAITDEAELERLRQIFDRLFAQGAGRADGNQFDLTGTDPNSDPAKAKVPQMLFPSKYAPELKQTRCWHNALSLGMQLLSVGDCTRQQLVVRDHAIVKPPGSTGSTPWHQDEAYWEDDTLYNELSVWIPLQDTTKQMGCLQFIPGSHKAEVVPHHRYNNDPRVIALEVDKGHIDESKAVACPLKAGSATIHDERMLHYSTGNNSAVPRRAFILTVGVPPRKLEKPRDFYWNHTGRDYKQESKTLGATKP